MIFNVVADEPVGWIASVVTGLIGAIWGAAVGETFDVMVGKDMAGFIVGAIGGFAVGTVIPPVLRLSWRQWLSHLTPRKQAMGTADQVINSISHGLLQNPFLLAGLIFGIISLVFFISHSFSTFLFADLLIALIIGAGIKLWSNIVEISEGSPWPHHYPLYCFWWRGRPTPLEVERALEAADDEEWKSLVGLIHEREDHPGSTKVLAESLFSPSWKWRVVAAHALASVGGQAVQHLTDLAHDDDPRIRKLALWILKGISKDTRARLRRDRNWLCPHCLTRAGLHYAELKLRPDIPYYGCRVCHQSREGLNASSVQAVLDSRMTGDWYPAGRSLRVHWLGHRTLFDLDRVVIECATDKEVEQFIVAVGNDGDEVRRARYKRIPCHVSRQCNLSENTMRILRNTFGKVVFHS